MPDFEELVAEILRRRPDISESELRHLIDEKKSRVGAGYLTDSGAAFLVASDLDVSLNMAASTDLSLQDLYIGAGEVTVIGRVFKLYPAKTYLKRDGSEGRYRRLILFDGHSYIAATLWDDKTGLIEDLGVKPDTPLRLRRGYVRAGLDGRPVIHLGERGDIEVVGGEELEGKLPTIEKVAQDVSTVTAPQINLAVNGRVKSSPRVSEFTRRDGGQGMVVQLQLEGLSGGRGVRVAVWNNRSESILNIPQGSVVRLVGLKSRLTPDGSVELHGDEGTFVEIISAQRRFREAGFERFRILSIGRIRRREDESTSVSMLVVDSSGAFYTLALKGDAVNLIGELKRDLMIECRFREVGASTLICESRYDVKVITEDDPSFPKTNTLFCKIRDVREPPSPLMLEVIALSKTSIQNLVTKKGEMVEKAEVLVGDETKEVKLVAWRDMVEEVSDIVPGERLRLIGVISSKGLNGVMNLRLKPYSRVEKIS